MPIEIKMPALSPTMEEGKLAKWLVKEGDTVSSGDIMAEIETDKATMEFEAVDEGTIGKIMVAEGSEGVKVGTVIALLDSEDEDASPAAPAAVETPIAEAPKAEPARTEAKAPEPAPAPAAPAAPKTSSSKDDRVIASPLAKRLAAAKGVDLDSLTGSGPHGRIIKADVEGAQPGTAKPKAAAPANDATPAPVAAAKPASVEMAAETRALLDDRIPHTVEKLSGMRKTIARRLTQSMQEAPHIYLTVDIRLDKLMAMRGELNAALEKQGVKVSVNDMLVKALGKALIDVPECNVTFAGAELIRYERADVSVAVSIPGGLITPIVQDANGKSFSEIARATKDLGKRAKEGKLQPAEYQGGTASISNMGMMGIKHFTAVINPPQACILAIGAGEKRPWVMPDGSLGVATVMTATGSFDHRAVDGADGARLMAAFKEYVESPLGMVA
ncbi:pyruvate dehydrogenase complex dihydrolipoamide acetyltransferase [Novosphingobium album (ex Hu et al. 2023)]|uniref:Acetyltransferase component of pyruvate dehydrogenase complex n=1 Tax=Novosphingobium album (ex Hu et al. 2023) TaxID=2930093 RepID=A0ABT0AY59_9SPHN|nr:pyruvate dehydrogenase complex dihydrolipoamide acetyltransferase [Novosphingobium album (ex Hu et al. 2023)]MCJ2177710.1 pyruvate dehydrogenase complex dihydrolipoamide acetyltransferase [Novosphingobium album (ex Hu et al. 2023)]